MTDTNQDAQDVPQEDTQEQPKTFDAEYVANLRKENAKYRTEAKANAEAAKRLAELEESQKSEAQKQDDRIKALEKQIADANVEVLRSQGAAKYGLSPEEKSTFVTGTTEEEIEAQCKGVSELKSANKNKIQAPGEGARTNPSGSEDRRAFVRQLTGRD